MCIRGGNQGPETVDAEKVPRARCLRKPGESGGAGEEEEPEITAEGKALLTSSSTGQAVRSA